MKLPGKMEPNSVLLAYGIAVTSVYVYTVYPSIPGGDSGELIQAAHELGVAHPPGYPLFTLLSWVAIKLVPFGPVAWRTNVLTALLAGTTSAVLAFTIYKYTDRLLVAITGSVLWSFGRLTWTWSSQTEVFSLNNLFVSVIMYLMVEFQTASTEKRKTINLLGSFVCGLSLTNQHTIIVYVFLVAIWVLSELAHSKTLNVSLLIQMAHCLVLGLLPYIYLPMSAALKPGRWTIGDQTTLRGFLVHILRIEYGTFDLAKGSVDRKTAFLKALWAYVTHIREDFGTVSCLLAILVFIYFRKWVDARLRRCLFTKTTMALAYITFFSWRANLGVGKNTLDRGVVERFWMQCDMVFILLVAVGLSVLMKEIRYRFKTVSENKMALYFLASLSTAQLYSGLSCCNNRHNTVISDYGLRLIQNFPKDALVLLRGDLQSNVVRYFYLCENLRPDIEVFDLEVLGSEFGLEMLRGKYPRIKFPHGKRLSSFNGELASGIPVFDIKTFLDANYDRFSAIINCNNIHPDHKSWESGYIRYPYGNCYKFIRKDARRDYEKIINQTHNISNGWPYRFDQFDRSTWENTANVDIWVAKVEIANTLFQDSAQVTDNTTKLTLQRRALQLYNYYIDQAGGKTLPSYWHRNYAIMLDTTLKREIRDGGDLFGVPKDKVIEMTLFHFREYIDREPHDPERELILHVMSKLEQVQETYKWTGKWAYE